jgi:hypothetical protein
MMLRTICCDAPGCDKRLQENEPGAGFPGWGALQGIALDGKENPALCPEHLAKLADLLATEKT